MDRMVLLLLAASALVAMAKPAIEPSPTGCAPEKLTVYQVMVNTFWTRDKFPKHYPDWRPPAQWSKTIGRSHDSSFSLFRLGERASSGVKLFAETGRSELLESQGQPKTGLLDEFQAPPITQGAGTAEATFFVDGNHSKVSLMSRIVPSPDWFIGVDSFDLCVNGNWIDSVTIELDPVDAGTDNGFTFTAPNWPTDPQGVVYRVTHTYPAHPAGSFYYPFMKRLPAIATFHFVKLREYELTEQFEHGAGKADYEVLRMEHMTHNTIDNNDVEEEQEERRRPLRVMTSTTTTTTEAPTTITTPSTTSAAPLMVNMTGEAVAASLPSLEQPVRRGDVKAIRDSIVGSYRSPKPRLSHRQGIQGKNRTRKLRPPRDCRVSDWEAWGECSKSCGIGEMQRRRQVIKHARRGGSPCPPLLETRWCGSARACNKGYFNW